MTKQAQSFIESPIFARFDKIMDKLKQANDKGIELDEHSILLYLYQSYKITNWTQARSMYSFFISILFGMLDYCIEEELYIEAGLVHKMLINKERDQYTFDDDEDDDFWNIFEDDDDY